MTIDTLLSESITTVWAVHFLLLETKNLGYSIIYVMQNIIFSLAKVLVQKKLKYT